MNDVMSRLMAVDPLPRGERLARWSEAGCRPSRKRAWNLLCRSPVLGTLEDALYDSPPEAKATFWRRYAAPLREARSRLRVARLDVEKQKIRVKAHNRWAGSMFKALGLAHDNLIAQGKTCDRDHLCSFCASTREVAF